MMGNRIYLTDFFVCVASCPVSLVERLGTRLVCVKCSHRGIIGKGSQHVMYQYRSINFNINITFI